MKQKSLKIISFISAFAMLVAVFSLTVIGGGGGTPAIKAITTLP